MSKPKKIIIWAVTGFVLSFLISVISTHKFGVSLLRALIVGLVFALMSLLVDFLNKKYLSVYDENASSEQPSTQDKGRGNLVNFTVNDENLTEDENAPSFSVSMNKIPLDDEKVSLQNSTDENPQENDSGTQTSSFTNSAPSQNSNKTDSAATQEQNSESSFRRVELGKKIDSSDFRDKINEGSFSKNSDSNSENSKNDAKKTSADVQEIDSLPDFGDETEDSSSEDENIISMSDFAEEGMETADSRGTNSADESKANNFDAGTIASAIRTILKRED